MAGPSRFHPMQHMPATGCLGSYQLEAQVGLAVGAAWMLHHAQGSTAVFDRSCPCASKLDRANLQRPRRSQGNCHLRDFRPRGRPSARLPNQRAPPR